MHRSILGAALAVFACATSSASAAEAAAACPPPDAPVVERFTRADCPDCWRVPGEAGATDWALDWIVPSPVGDDAPMSAAALIDADQRLQRTGSSSRAQGRSVLQRTDLPAVGMPRVEVQIGPAWYGYFALRMAVRGRVAPGSTGWLALIEELPAGAEGNADARALVRSVAGPFSLAALQMSQPVIHLAALRWPENARPERLRARGWVERRDGRMVAMASDACPSARR